MKGRKMEAKKVTVSAISDLHGDLLVNIPACDVLVIAGDICPVNASHHPRAQALWLTSRFYPWCEGLLKSSRARAIVFTPGNHDFVFGTALIDDLGLPPGVVCLVDREATVCGLRIYGTPWTPVFGDWAFMEEDSRLIFRFSGIPTGLDLLVSHGPAYGWCDTVASDHAAAVPPEHLGSKSLRDAVRRAKPRWMVCGHIHTGSHVPVSVIGGAVTVVNVSAMDEDYQTVMQPRVLDFFTEGETK